LDLSPRPEELPRCLDPDLRRLSPYPDEKSRPVKEILEFPSEVVSPDLTYCNLLYLYPKVSVEQDHIIKYFRVNCVILKLFFLFLGSKFQF